MDGGTVNSAMVAATSAAAALVDSFTPPPRAGNAADKAAVRAVNASSSAPCFRLRCSPSAHTRRTAWAAHAAERAPPPPLPPPCCTAASPVLRLCLPPHSAASPPRLPQRRWRWRRGLRRWCAPPPPWTHLRHAPFSVAIAVPFTLCSPLSPRVSRPRAESWTHLRHAPFSVAIAVPFTLCSPLSPRVSRPRAESRRGRRGQGWSEHAPGREDAACTSVATTAAMVRTSMYTARGAEGWSPHDDHTTAAPPTVPAAAAAASHVRPGCPSPQPAPAPPQPVRSRPAGSGA